MTHPSKSELVLGICIVQILGSISYPIARYGLTNIDPFVFAFFRFLLAGTILFGLTRYKKMTPPIERKDMWVILALGVLIIGLNQLFFLVGQSMTAASHGAIMYATQPAWIYLFSLVLGKELFNWRRIGGIVLAVAGAIVIVASAAKSGDAATLTGDVILFISVCAWAVYVVLGRPLVQKYGALRVTAYALSFGSLLYAPFGFWLAMGTDYSQVPVGVWGSIAFMAIGISIVVYVLVYWLIKYIDASRVAVIHNVQPVIATAVAWLFLGETVGLVFVVGSVIVLAGVILSEV
ncbi:MAG: DMT family transporter [Candidatus Zixiibacteriota bacterium]